MQYTESFIPYTIQVYASTAAGRGRAASTMMFTGHGGDLLTACAIIIIPQILLRFNNIFFTVPV